jgi:hypothetical protein
MSGPGRDRQLYWLTHDQWNHTKVNQLRTLADMIDDDGAWWTDELGVEDAALCANLLRGKADRIEAAIETINRETHDDFDDLVRAIQYARSGDWGGDAVVEAWESYGERNE